MAFYKIIESKRSIMGKLSHNSDLLEELTEICQKENISLGTVQAIGAVQSARIGYYDQDQRKYDFIDIDQHLEIASLIGNISLKDDKPMIHAHAVFSDDKGACHAGHLAPGTKVFACEFVITECDGPDFIRDHDEQTGLPLWKT